MDKIDIVDVKNKIKSLIDINELEQAKSLLNVYSKGQNIDIEIYNLKAICAMMENQMYIAKEHLFEGILSEYTNVDLLFNLAYLYELVELYADSIHYYKLAQKNSKTSAEKEEIRKKIETFSLDNLKVGELEGMLSKSFLDAMNEREYDAVITELQSLLKRRKFKVVFNRCNYWLETSNDGLAIINYLKACSMNGLGRYDEAKFHHCLALELDGNFADIRNNSSKKQEFYEEEETVCIGCGHEMCSVVNVCNQSISENNKELINPIVTWVECEQCGLIYRHLLPSDSKLNAYYSIIAKEKFGGIYGDIDERFEFLVKMSNERLAKIERYLGDFNRGKHKILDIGTGIGIFTGVAIDRGWNATGLELTPEDCAYAKEHFDIELKQENFYNFEENEQYDVVTLFEVIEHLRHPLKDLKQINKLVVDNGILVIATPIQDTLHGKKTKEDNVFWNVVTHLSYFKREVMMTYICEAGFKVLEINNSDEGMGRLEFYCQKIN